MGNYEQLKQAVSNVIKTNGTQAITGKVLQNTLLTMINSLGGNFQFVGIATTATNPGTPDQNVFYLAGEGTYTNFSNIVIDTGQLGVLKWNGSWSKQVLEIGSGGGNMILDWNTDVATTRKQVLTKYRKPGIQISYKDPVNGWINEQFVGTSTDDNNWAKDINWLKIANQNQINEIIDDISIINPKVLNLQDALLNANGTTGASGLWSTSDYIEVKRGDELRIILSNPPSGTYAPVALYNTEKTLLQSYTVSNYPKELTIEQDGFIRACGQKGTTIKIGNPQSLQDLADKVSVLESEKDVKVESPENINLFYGVKLHPSGYYQFDAECAVSDYIEVKKGDKFYIYISEPYDSPYVGLQVYDTNKHVKSNYVKPNIPTDIIIQEDGYIRIGGKYSGSIKLNKEILLNNYVTNLNTQLETIIAQYPEPLNLTDGLLLSDGSNDGNLSWKHSDYIEVKKGDIINCFIQSRPSGKYLTAALYDTDKTFTLGYDNNSNRLPFFITIEQDGFIRVCGQKGTLIEVNKIITLQYIADIVSSLEYKFGSVVGIEKNINFVGMSIWWYDGKTLADGGSGIGGGEIAIGYQTLLKNVYRFLSDTGTKYCYSGSSLGATSEDDSSSICSKMGTWQPSENAIWTLDTITNDFVRDIPLGEKTDYDNNTGKTTYYGALRVFADKITELSGDDKIVIVSNTCLRNGWNTQTINKNGNTIVDFEKALMYAAVKNKWWFVDQFRLSGITSDTALFTTIDGTHLNNLGYKMAIVPWFNVFRCIFGK